MEKVASIRIQNLVKNYPDFSLQVFDLELDSKGVYTLVGKNGFGKTVFFQAILDLIPLDDGKVELLGFHNRKQSQWKKSVRSYFGDEDLIPFLSPQEYFKTCCRLLKSSYDEFSQFCQEHYPELTGELFSTDKALAHLSAGNKQKTGILSCLIGDPKLILLDEPYNHLDPNAQQELTNLIKEQGKKGTVLLSNHYLDRLKDYSGEVLLLKDGTISFISPELLSPALL